MADTSLVEKKTEKEICEGIKEAWPITHPRSVLRRIQEGEGKPELVNGEAVIRGGDLFFRALTMEEFNLGILMNRGFKEELHTFSVDLSLKLQAEYNCQKPSEQATAQLVAHSYCRVMDIQRRINNCLSGGNFTEAEVKYVAVLSKELDRAERHYLAALQTLQALKQPPVNLTVKTQQANFAQNMITQQKGEYEPK